MDATRTHIAYLPHLAIWQVYCDHGCNLGTSATQPTMPDAVKRAELHALAGCGVAAGPWSTRR
jgi:hypothetical protein